MPRRKLDRTRTRPAPVAKKDDSNESSEEEFEQPDDDKDESNESDESDQVNKSSRKRTPQRKSPRLKSPRTQSSKRKKKVIESSEDSSSEEVEYQDSEDDDDDEEEDVVTRGRKQFPRRNTRTRMTAVTPSQQSRRQNSARKSTPKKLHAKKEVDSSSDSSVDPSPPRSRRKQRRDEDEEEFVPSTDVFSEENDDDDDEEEGDDAEDVWSDEDESEDEESQQSDDSKIGRVGGIDEIGDANDSTDESRVDKNDELGDIGIANDSSDDDDIPKKVPAAASKRKSRGQLNSSDDSSGNSSDDTEIKPAARAAKCKSCYSPKIAMCTSKHDAITMEELPWPHVCFFPPEGERQCFALETLRQIALNAGHPEFRNDRVKETTKQTYLQPPHFRTAMSDELLDQIASRFSREALDLDSSYHTRPLRPERPPYADSGDGDYDDEEDYNYNMRMSGSDVWDMMGKYLHRTMGSADLYVCPVCYRVAHKRCLSGKQRKSPGKLSDDQLSAMYPNKYTIDPMHVLGSVDDEDFKLASMFCFRKLPLLKQHLKEEHGLDTSVVEGNDLYKMYKVSGRFLFSADPEIGIKANSRFF